MQDDLVRRIASHPKYQELKSKRTSFGWWLTLAGMLAYYGFILLVAFDKPAGLLSAPDRWDKQEVHLVRLAQERFGPETLRLGTWNIWAIFFIACQLVMASTTGLPWMSRVCVGEVPRAANMRPAKISVMPS